MTTTRSAPARHSRFWAYGLPVIIAFVQVVGSLRLSGVQPGREELAWPGVILLLLGPALLMFRRRYTVLVFAGVMLVSLAYVLLGYPYGPFMLSAIVALVETVRMGHRLAGWLGGIGLVVGHWGLRALFGSAEAPSAAEMAIILGWILVILIGAELLRGHQERRLERRRAQEAEEAGRLTEERLRIARELHDVVAHNISLINVQAGSALHLMDAKPEQARTALTAIKQASKEALVELRSILGVLRQVDGQAGQGTRQPTPGLARLGELVDGARQAGLRVETQVPDELELPSSVDVAAYRIAQEALTNVLRHAAANRVDLTVSYTGGTLVVEVTDDGRGPVPTETPGSGLIGMRERAAAVGGTLEAGARAVGGFRVRAELPVEELPVEESE